MAVYDVDTDGGGSYSDLNSAIAALPGSPTENDTITLTGATDDTSTVSFDGYGYTYGGFTLTVTAATGDFHQGTWDTSKYILTNAAATNLTVRDSGTYWVGFQIENTNSGSSSMAGMNVSEEVYFVHLYLKNNDTGASDGGIYCNGAAATVRIYGCIIVDCNAYGISCANGEVDAEGCLVDNGGAEAYKCAGGEIFTLRNSIAINTTAFASAVAFNTGTGNNATDLSSMGYSGGANDITDIVLADNFTNAGSRDYTIKDSGADIYAAGQSLSYLTEDLVGYTYGSPPSIGPFELQVAGSWRVPPTIFQNANRRVL